MSSHSAADRLRAYPGENHNFWICPSGLRCCLPHEVCVTPSVTLKPLRLNIEHIGMAGRIRGYSQPEVRFVHLLGASS